MLNVELQSYNTVLVLAQPIDSVGNNGFQQLIAHPKLEVIFKLKY